MRILIGLNLLIITVLVISPGLVFATGHPPSSVDDIVRILEKLFNIAYRLFFAAAAFTILFAAYNYLTAQGSAEKLKKAQDMLLYSVIAIIIALISLSVDNIIASLVGGT